MAVGVPRNYKLDANVPVGSFAALFREYRERANVSRHRLAHEVGCDTSYLTRCEWGDRDPPRAHIVEAIARGLRLPAGERDRLLVAAGYAPLCVPEWGATLQAVADVLNDSRLSAEERQQFEDVVQMIAARWSGHRAGPARDLVEQARVALDAGAGDGDLRAAGRTRAMVRAQLEAALVAGAG